MDLPPRPIKLARDNANCEILSTGSGCRDATDLKDNFVPVIAETIPIQFRQKTYDKNNGCVRLSTCLLVNSVDTEITDKMIQCYKTDEKKFEWLDIFNRKSRSNEATTILT